MSGLEDLVAAAMSAPPERREAALRLLQGDLPKPEPFLSLSELARRLGFCRATLRRWQVPGHDVGGNPRYRLTEVEAYFITEAYRRRQAALRAERRRATKSKPLSTLASAATGPADANNSKSGRQRKEPSQHEH